MTRVTPFLMFDGRAEEAMTFYCSVFPNARISAIRRYGTNEGGAEGTVMQARFELSGQTFICIDSPVEHAFTFTPAFSLFVECAGEEEIDRAFERLTDGGEVLMPLDRYPFAAKFAWINDRFGVSWQLDYSG